METSGPQDTSAQKRRETSSSPAPGSACGRTANPAIPAKSADPCQRETERRRPLIPQRPLHLLADSMGYEQQPVIGAPDDECGAGSCQRPTTTMDKTGWYRPTSDLGASKPAAGTRNRESRRERHVPPRPESGRGRRQIGPAEILIEMDADQTRCSNHDVRVAGKIKEQLKAEADYQEPDVQPAPLPDRFCRNPRSRPPRGLQPAPGSRPPPSS